MPLDNPENLPPRPGDGLKSTVVDEGGGNILILYEIRGTADGENFISATDDSLVEDPDASRNV